MSRIAIADRAALLLAAREGSWAERYYLDVDTGQVVCVLEADRARLQPYYDAHGEVAAADHLPQGDARLRAAHAVELDDARYVKLPVLPARQELEWMDAFAGGVDPALRSLLWRALDRDDRSAFERTLRMEPAVARAWSAERDRRLTAWLRAAWPSTAPPLDL